LPERFPLTADPGQRLGGTLLTWAQVWIKGGVWWLASQTGLRYKGGNGNHDRLTIGLPGLETVASYPAGGWCRAGSDRVEANRSARGEQADHYCKPLRTRFLHRARVHWIVVKKRTGLGILALIVASTVLGFGLHVLLRVLTH